LPLSVGVIVSLVELPGTLLGWDFTHVMCVVGWLFVLAGTAFLNFRFTAHSIRLDVFQIVGGIGLLLIFGSFMYMFAVLPYEAKVTSLFDLAKYIFILNGCAALVSAVSCYFVLAMASGFATFNKLGR
jgi:low temperature requirement protein LtrA